MEMHREIERDTHREKETDIDRDVGPYRHHNIQSPASSCGPRACYVLQVGLDMCDCVRCATIDDV